MQKPVPCTCRSAIPCQTSMGSSGPAPTSIRTRVALDAKTGKLLSVSPTSIAEFFPKDLRRPLQGGKRLTPPAGILNRFIGTSAKPAISTKTSGL
jgi:hypothetical protein